MLKNSILPFRRYNECQIEPAHTYIFFSEMTSVHVWVHWQGYFQNCQKDLECGNSECGTHTAAFTVMHPPFVARKIVLLRAPRLFKPHQRLDMLMGPNLLWILHASDGNWVLKSVSLSIFCATWKLLHQS